MYNLEHGTRSLDNVLRDQIPDGTGIDHCFDGEDVGRRIDGEVVKKVSILGSRRGTVLDDSVHVDGW